MRVARSTSVRAQVLTARSLEADDREVRCDDCGTPMDINVMMYVRGPSDEPTTTANASVLCGYCNSALSRKKFYKNNPTASLGWGRRRAAERAVQGLPKRKSGRRRPQEIPVTADVLEAELERQRLRGD